VRHHHGAIFVRVVHLEEEKPPALEGDQQRSPAIRPVLARRDRPYSNIALRDSDFRPGGRSKSDKTDRPR
jgi:hypothetical protein